MIDGIFMDKFKAGHYLHATNKSNLKVFLSVDMSEGVKYDLAVLADLANNSCFKSAIMKRDVDELLLQYLKPVAVRNKSDLIRTKEGHTNTVNCCFQTPQSQVRLSCRSIDLQTKTHIRASRI